MAKQKTQESSQTKSSGEITFSIVGRDAIPTIARAGRTSKYEPLYAKAKEIGKDEVIQLPIAKYSQVQAFKSRLNEMGLEVAVRKTENGLSAFISYPAPEEKS